MNRIITRPEEIVKNEQVLYVGNHYLSVPIIVFQNGAIKNINVVSLSNKTFLLPSDDPSDYPLVTIDNVILWRGLQILRDILLKKGKIKKAQLIKQKIENIHKGIYKYLIKEIEEKKIFLRSTDGKKNFRLYNDPPGSWFCFRLWVSGLFSLLYFN